MTPVASELEHPALQAAPAARHTAGAPLGEVAARLTDRLRLGALLQGAAVLAHLERAGRSLPAGWESARLDIRGQLSAVSVSDAGAPPGARLLAPLVMALFAGDGGVAGPGEVRRALRLLLPLWDQTLVALRPDRAVAGLFAAAPPLWSDAFGPARAALAATLVAGDRRTLLVAGPAPLRRIVRRRCTHREEAAAFLAAPGVPTAEPRSAARAPAVSSSREPAIASPLARRRRQEPEVAAAGWRERARARLAAGSLAEAARALRHATLLLAGPDPVGARGALLALAAVRVRQGRLDGVTSVLAERPPSDIPAIAGGEKLLAARLALAGGEPARALAILAAGGGAPARRGWPDAELRRPACILAARAFGWRGQAREAARCLEGMPAADLLRELSPEERPAIWVLAGRTGRARSACDAAGPAAEAWRALLAGAAAPDILCSPGGIEEVLGTYRAARLAFDLELAAPRWLPPSWRRRSAAELRCRGAVPLAERLDRAERRPWASISRYIEGSQQRGDSLCELFLGSGYPEARLVWMGSGEESVLVDGGGGEAELAAPLAGGRLVLRAPRIDAGLETLFALALRDAHPAAASSGAAGIGAARDDPASTAGGLLGRSLRLREAIARLERLAAEDIPLLIVGETGTGKELAARRAHAVSRRRAGAFLPVNCAALSTTLLLSDLFGHIRGAFTGAESGRTGVFEAAHGGTVFLDEVGDLPAAAQGMLLRVLQEGEIRRLGETRPRRVDVRVIAATHRDLGSPSAAGTFRPDLLYRLKVGSVELPPLRERGDDVLLLAEHFLAQRANAGRRHLARSAAERLLAHSWPGNVRELQAVIAVAAVLTSGEVISARHLELPQGPQPRPAGYHQQVRALRRRLVEDALATARGNRARAARQLGLSRQALCYLVRQLGIG